MDDRLLVKRAKRGDVDAFAELYGKIYEKLYHFAFYMLKNAQDEEDAVSEAVTDAFEGIRKLKREESFANWMYQIVANKCRRKMREYCRRTVSLDREQSGEEDEFVREWTKDEVGNSVAAESVDVWDSKREEYMQLRQEFMKLPEEDRLIIGMHVFFGYKTREIAAFLKMNENTVRSKESRAIQKLAKQLDGLR